MSSPRAIHVTGASGSGTTTLGAALRDRLGCVHLDTDAFYWEPSEPPFLTARPIPERRRLLERDLDAAGARGWVLSGSVRWADELLLPRLDLVVFLRLPWEIRHERLLARERVRSPSSFEEGSERRAGFLAFLEWAEQYDAGAPDIRSRAFHEGWLARLPCPVLRLEGDLDVAGRVDRVVAALGGTSADHS